MGDEQRLQLGDEQPALDEGRRQARISRSVFRDALCLGAATLTLGGAVLANSCQKHPESIRHHRQAVEFDRVLRQFEGVGFSGVVLVLKDGEPVLGRSYGFSRRREGVRNTVSTPFYAQQRFMRSGARDAADGALL